MPLKKASGTFNYKLTIPQNVEEKIRYLLEKIHNIEWSGKLFYDYKGTFENNDLEIICRDIFLMDIGNSTYTEFDDESTDFGNYMLTHGLLKCKIGLCHSHHAMTTFFSATDKATLFLDGSEMNNFVSLIVNNAGTYSAAITRKVTIKRNIQDEFYQPFFGEEVKPMSKTSREQDVQYVEWFDLKVEKEASKALTEIDERIIQVKEMKAKKAKEEATKKVVVENQYGNYTNVYGNYQSTYNKDAFWDNTPEVQQPLNPKESWDKQNPASYSPYIPIDSGFEDDDKVIDDVLTKFILSNLTESGIMQIVHKLITGSIVASKLDKKSLDTWKRLMEVTYDRAFADLREFEEFAEWYVEFIISNISWELYKKLDTDTEELKDTYIGDDSISKLLAGLVYDRLQDFPQNKYIKGYSNVLINIMKV